MPKDISTQILSDIIVYNKYAKYLPNLKRREVWSEIIDRNKEMHIRKFPNLKDEIEQAYSLVYEKKILPSMRSLQFGGKPIEINPARIFNCCYLPVDSIYAFNETMFLLLGGTGVGFSVQTHHIANLPVIKKPLERKKRFLIGDSIEGWADSIKVLFEAYFNGKCTPVFDYSDIRSKGSQLITSGGKAPGPEPLKRCIEVITSILDSKQVGEKLSSIECHDIQCHIADAVLAGGIRRAALISLFSVNDEDLLNCKSNFQILSWDHVYSEGPLSITGEKVNGVKQIHVDQVGNTYYDIIVTVNEPGYGITENKLISWIPESSLNELKEKGTLPWYHFQPQRGRSNNSALILRHRINKSQFMKLWKRVEESGSGEPGVYFSNDKDLGTNPCFTGDTLVAVADGRTAVSIKELADSCNGEFNIPVYSARLSQASGWIAECRMAKAFKTGTKEVVRVSLSNGSSFECTENHLLATPNGVWVQAQHSTEWELETISSTPITVLSISYEGKVEDVYDLTVEDNHNFYIEVNPECKVLVHNCVEISLRPFQMCNLVEVDVSDLSTQEELNIRCKAAAFIGTIQASYTDFHYLRDIWKSTTDKDALLGVSHTGIASSNFSDISLEEAAEVVLKENERVAELLGINISARTTAVKPSGTASCVVGSSSGIHAWHNDYYIRRIRISKSESLYKHLALNHPELLEDEHFNPQFDACIKIPIKAPDGAILRDEKVENLLNRVKRWNTEWIKSGHRDGQNTHNVSATVSVKPDDWKVVGDWIWNNRESFNGLSVLPFDGGTYIQAPFEDITKEQYEEAIKHLTSVDLSKVIEVEDNTNLSGEIACSGGACEIK